MFNFSRYLLQEAIMSLISVRLDQRSPPKFKCLNLEVAFIGKFVFPRTKCASWRLRYLHPESNTSLFLLLKIAYLQPFGSSLPNCFELGLFQTQWKLSPFFQKFETLFGNSNLPRFWYIPSFLSRIFPLFGNSNPPRFWYIPSFLSRIFQEMNHQKALSFHYLFSNSIYRCSWNYSRLTKPLTSFLVVWKIQIIMILQATLAPVPP